MKSLRVSLIFISVILLSFGVKAEQRFSYYEDLTEVVEAVVDASWDLPAGPHWKLFPIKKGKVLSGCSSVDGDWAYEQIAAGIESFAAFYVDEELPYASAFEQLRELADSDAFQICQGGILKGPIPLIIEL